jgi:purine-binding chemotaxis protein CheW
VTTYVRFRLAAEEYAIPVSQVREVITLGEVTPVPGAQPDVLGIRNLRGQILPVIDLAKVLRVTRAAQAVLLMIAEAGGQLAGLAIDEVSGVADLPEPNADADSALLAGSLLLDGELIGVVDMPRVVGALAEAGR